MLITQKLQQLQKKIHDFLKNIMSFFIKFNDFCGTYEAIKDIINMLIPQNLQKILKKLINFLISSQRFIFSFNDLWCIYKAINGIINVLITQRLQKIKKSFCRVYGVFYQTYAFEGFVKQLVTLLMC